MTRAYTVFTELISQILGVAGAPLQRKICRGTLTMPVMAMGRPCITSVRIVARTHSEASITHV